MENKNFSSKTMKHLKNETHHEAFKNIVKPIYKEIELDPLRIKVEMERKICFKRMFTIALLFWFSYIYLVNSTHTIYNFYILFKRWTRL